MERKRNLDLLKAICAFMVICIHAPFSGRPGEWVKAVSSIAVPVFFMITGYFYTHTKEMGNEKKQILKIVRLYISSGILYFVWDLVNTCLTGGVMTDWLAGLFNAKARLYFVLLNLSPVGVHLWYLLAIIYVLLIVFFFEKKWNRQKLYPLIPVLILGNLMIEHCASDMFGQPVKNIWTRNFLFTGLPYFLIGDMIFTRQIAIKPCKSFLLALVFTCTTVLERVMINMWRNGIIYDHYYSTAFLSFFVFMLAVHSNCDSRNKCTQVLSNFGKTFSTEIYILHPIVIDVFRVSVGYLIAYSRIFYAYYYLETIVVFVCTTVLVWGIHHIKKVAKTKSVQYRSNHP